MVTPKSLIFQLHQHWEVVEQLTRLSREVPAFEFRMLEKVINQHKNKTMDSNSVLTSLVNADILQPINRSSDYQLNTLVVDFVRGLSQEHELGLSAVLKARIDAIKDATGQVLEGLDEEDNYLLRTGANRLSELLRKITQQLTQDKQAIFEIAELAKSADTNTPIERRYREVLEVYDQYVEPMNEMMDSGLGGSFYPLLEKAEEALDHAVDMLSIRGSLYQQRLAMRQIAYQVKDLRYQGRVIAQQCADTLLPLREESRQHNQLSAVVSKQLSQVRKKGLVRGLNSNGLPLWKGNRVTKIQLDNQVRELMAEFMNFEPSSIPFPDEEEVPASSIVNWVDEEYLREQLAHALPVENLMTWLSGNYRHLPDAELLRLYHELVRDHQWESTLGVNSNTTELNTVVVTYHPHEIKTLVGSTNAKDVENAK
ncbi:conserved hypothetical protein [Vibrio crassostreae]|uniref:hypothetical protein n=1 Tax=Vibrio TaxID=662 RepID=UPI000F4719D7|nr:hypothetical protein [Vibrio crassostreae]ROR15994.1 hypothetical protein EDB36_104111 [Vibrio crassostreae]CAK2075174.1 conserved hypothetical protein [Vibrio crassostreae]CAK2344134.1 conserved hypothetical protein [Vibrio crassostreae]CAK2355648.1 conserved hypothetical protein [Vibrio crassostreae]CAK3412312.1 conserved hypothetical protein [Vibrio crassostreae]